MITRRHFLGLSLAAIAAPPLARALPPAPVAAEPDWMIHTSDCGCSFRYRDAETADRVVTYYGELTECSYHSGFVDLRKSVYLLSAETGVMTGDVIRPSDFDEP